MIQLKWNTKQNISPTHFKLILFIISAGVEELNIHENEGGKENRSW